MIVPVSLFGRVFGKTNVLQRPEIPVGEFLVEIFGNLFDVEGVIVAFLNLQCGDVEQFFPN
jgi:hypothetical protein